LTVPLGWKEAYDHNESVIYLLDADLRISRCNSAWDRFAVANSGEDVIRAKVVGRSVMDVVPAVLQDFYRIAYENVRKARREWWHVFECSSPSVLRHFHMRILPSGGGGLVTISTLIDEAAADVSESPSIHDVVDEDGIATMCAHCRRVQRIHRPDIWIWAPELLIRGKVLTRPGLCDFCEAYHRHRR
jgi:hypothetical protein